MSVVRGTALSNYPELVTELGGDPRRLLARAGIRPMDIGHYEVFVPLRGVVFALESAAEETATPDFGRRLARRQGIEILGPVGVAARTAATVGDAMAIFGTFLAAYSPALSVRAAPVPDRPERSFFEFHILMERLPPVIQSVELSLGVILEVLRLLLGAAYCPLSVHVPHEPVTPAAQYREYFGCRPYFAEPVAGFTLRTADLSGSLQHDELAHRAVVEYLSTLIGPRGPDMSQSVRTIARQLLPTGAAKLEVIAAQFNIHPKTLQRRLADEGTTFFELIDDLRRETAEHYLRDTDIDLSHLARELGYTEQSVLTRSCKRWFGTGPAAYRRALRPRRHPAFS
ncbi:MULTISPECIES: AraC family transcriptional regulator [unclassified Mycobacterium]|uniref:AraC family transcriptional regulator n=1 Tax=unclassified Mycobacterium TaxID=2642494 RepID=UPI0008021C6A|nr:MULTISPECIES: AraC family transcriptional regulator [unclassified Mycobacterium]OBG55311.1 AraC family transcriptional regulator [Mycobacterium sp. E735]OBH25215.1 AraC family transcriptional regulator [Mycobacterium sp. E1715]